MTSAKNRLRTMIHVGARHQAHAAVNEIIDRDDADLYDWVLQAARVRAAARSEHWRWKYGDTRVLRHPSLDDDLVLTLLARARGDRAIALRAELGSLCLELEHSRRHEQQLDVSMMDGMTEVRELRLMPCDPENLYAWREDLMGKAKRLPGFAAVGDMTRLERLTVIGGTVDLAVLTKAPALTTVELIACDLTELDALAELNVAELTLSCCPGVEQLDPFPAGVEQLRLEVLPALKAIAPPPDSARLKSLTVIGAPELDALPALPNGAEGTLSAEMPTRDSFD